MHEVKDGKVIMSTGVVFRIKDTGVMALDAIRRKMLKSEPQVPEVYIEDKGRKEPNPNDPGYIKAKQEWDQELTDKLINASIVMSVEIESLPEKFPTIEDCSWADKLKYIDLDVPEDAYGRKITWVKYCAAPTTEDIYSLFLACARRAGVTEEDVAEASAMFPGRAGRSTNRNTSDKERRQFEDKLREDAPEPGSPV